MTPASSAISIPSIGIVAWDATKSQWTIIDLAAVDVVRWQRGRKSDAAAAPEGCLDWIVDLRDGTSITVCGRAAKSDAVEAWLTAALAVEPPRDGPSSPDVIAQLDAEQHGDGGGAPFVPVGDVLAELEAWRPTHRIKVQGWNGRAPLDESTDVMSRGTGDPTTQLLTSRDGSTIWTLVRGELYYAGEACDRSLGAFQRVFGRPQSGRNGHYSGATARCVPIEEGKEL